MTIPTSGDTLSEIAGGDMKNRNSQKVADSDSF